jgi:hypothetical protein
MMKVKLFTALFCLLGSIVFAQDTDPKIPKFGSSLKSFVPKGWKTILQQNGDLNKDGLADHAIVIECTDAENFLKNDGLGVERLNLNPRLLLIVFKISANSYRLVSIANSNFIPSANDADNSCLSDPLLQDGGISIENGLLIVSFQYFYSCGSWYVTNKNYTFRFQNQKFELIGYDDSDFHRSSGEKSSTSINFSTKRRSDTTGGNEFNDVQDKPKTIWTKIKVNKLPTLETITEEFISEFYGK